MSDHRPDITLWRYNSDVSQAGYLKTLEYTTTKKYGAGRFHHRRRDANIEAKLP